VFILFFWSQSEIYQLRTRDWIFVNSNENRIFLRFQTLYLLKKNYFTIYAVLLVLHVSALPQRSVYCICTILTLNLLTTTIVAPPSNASKWQMGFNSAFKGLNWKTWRYKLV
jgi:hypothetical protein